jgi:hypothetical protein
MDSIDNSKSNSYSECTKQIFDIKENEIITDNSDINEKTTQSNSDVD